MNKYSFRDILEKEITIMDKPGQEKKLLLSKIEIPKIQRDYAQGRPQENEIRKRFLDNIFNTLLSTDERSMEMDFVYGSVDENTKTFTPLDGQQRLTTLFLLYGYVGTRELKDTSRAELSVLLKKFTYETRMSSRNFCEKLTEQLTSDINIEFKDKPSKEITNLYWFYKSYRQDPTIKSMLNMLDAIHEKYGNKPLNLFDKLQRLQFYILPLNEFKLTDELYVKMNARGKQLTNFENFKADLIKWMKDENNPYLGFFNESTKIDDREMPCYLFVSQKMDVKWTQFFWKIIKDKNIKVEEKDENGNPVNCGELVDLLFMQLFHRYFLNKYCLLFRIQFEQGSKRMIFENETQEANFNNLLEGKKYQNFNPFEMILKKDNIIQTFVKFLDSLTDNWEEVKEAIQPSWIAGESSDNKWHFFQEDITQSSRVIFLGIMLFIENNLFDGTKFKQWMRIVWNLVENTDIDGLSPMYGAMELVRELSDNSSNIYAFLADKDNLIKSSSSSHAVKEERQKAGFIVKDISWEKVLIDAEKHPFFRGCVGFIITDEMMQDDFKHRTEMAKKVFDKNGVNKNYQKDGHIFLRALISRYTDEEQIINKNFTDTEEKEHYLKKWLASDNVVRCATREWFDLRNEEELLSMLKKCIDRESSINDIKIRQAHEELYQKPDLQNWMQTKKAIRFNRRLEDSHLYVSKPHSWYAWIMLDTNRNRIISDLLSLYGFQFKEDENRPVIKNNDNKPIYFLGYNIIVTRKIGQYNLHIEFNCDNCLYVEIKKKQSKKTIKDKYDGESDWIKKIMDKTLTEEYLNEIFSKS
jgi:hypothetical protein